MKLSFPRVILLCLLFLLTAILLRGVDGVNRTPIKRPLENFPLVLEEWEAFSSKKSSDEVIKLLGVDDYVEYNYSKSDSVVVNFYVAFYEAVGNGTGYHSPKNCIPGGGWGIDTTGLVQITPKGSKRSVNISELLIRNGSEYQVVYYWYQNRGRIIYSEYWEKVYLVVDSVLKKRRDGTFVRLIAPVPDGDVDNVRKVLTEFAELVVPELDKFIPGSGL